MKVVALFPDVQIAHVVKLHECAEDSLVRQVIPQLVSQLGQVEGILAEGTEDGGKALGIDREIRVLQQLRGDGGLVGMIVMQGVHSGSPFSFEKVWRFVAVGALAQNSPFTSQRTK